MRWKSETIRLVGFVACLLILYPTVFAFFVHSSTYSDGLRTSFLLFKQPMLVVLGLTLFYLFAKSGRGDACPRSETSPSAGVAPTLSKWKEFIGFFFAGTLCLALSTATQIDLNQILNSGVSIHNKKVHWDTQRWGGVPFLSESDPVGEQYLWLSTPDQRLMVTLQVGARHAVPLLKWYGLWHDGNGNGVLDDQVWLNINGQRYDVTEQYQKIPPQTPQVLMLTHVGAVREPPLQLILSKTSAADSIGWVGQTSYLTGQTREWKMENGKWGQTPFMEAMVWVEQKNHPFYSFLFKIGYWLRWAGMVLLFFAFFGRRWVFGFLKRSPRLAVISLAYAPLILLLGVGLRESWPWMAQGIGWSLYGLLKLGFPTAFIDIPDPTHVKVGTAAFHVNIADTCSGIESIGLFCGMYLGLVLFNYRSLRLNRALMLAVPGLIGVYAVNLLRIYVIFLIGAFGAGEAVVDLFHSYLGMVLFIVYFLLFWQISQKKALSPSSFKMSPAIVSGLMILLLVSGHAFFVSSPEGFADCGYATYTCSGSGPNYCGGSEADQCTSRQTDYIGCQGGDIPSFLCTPVGGANICQGCLKCGTESSQVIPCAEIPEFPLCFMPLLSALLIPVRFWTFKRNKAA